MQRTRQFAALGLTCFLAACSGGAESTLGQSALLKDSFQALRQSRKKPEPLPVVTRALLDSLTVSSLQVVRERNDQTAFMIPAAQRSDGTAGIVTIWRSAGTDHLILRSGVVISTKGVGYDLASHDAVHTLQAVHTRSAVSGAKTLYIHGDNNEIQELRLQCDMTNLGAKSIEIVERHFATIHLRETCTHSTGQFTNDYWVDRNNSTMWKSRQWIGPSTGYLSLTRLKK